jgi:protein-disulfide isomerase
MQSISSRIRSPIRSLLLLLVGFSLSVGSGPLALAQDGGYSSPNPDHPPEVSPDIGSRSVDPDRPPAYGPEDAKVRIILFSDYKCPACRRVSPATQQISAEFPGEVRIEVWHRPLAMHAGADTAAAAAVAAQRQGKFWEMHDRIIENTGPLDVARLEEFAVELGLELDQFRSDMNDPSVMERIRKENAMAEAMGAVKTPGWLINGKVSEGWGSWRSFRTRVEQELTAANALAVEGMDPMEIQRQRAAANLENPEKYELYRTGVLLAKGEPAKE